MPPATREKRPPSDVALRPVAIAKSEVTPEAIHRVITAADLALLTPQDQIVYYLESCRDLGINWRTKPFIIANVGQGGQKMYLTVDGAEQLAAVHNISLSEPRFEEKRNAIVCTLTATLPNGRTVTKTGGAALAPNVAGAAYVDALKKAESQTYRRVIKAAASLNHFHQLATGQAHQPEPIPEHEIAEAAALVASAVVVAADESEADETAEEAIAEIIQDAEFHAIEEEPLPQMIGRMFAVAKTRGFTDKTQLALWLAEQGIDASRLERDEVTWAIAELEKRPA